MKTMRIEARLSLGRLGFEPVKDRLTVFAAVTLIWFTVWLMRWDSERCAGKRVLFRSADRLMCWTAGIRR